MPNVSSNAVVRETKQELAAPVKVRKWSSPPILNSRQTTVVCLTSKNKILRTRNFSKLSWFSLMRTTPIIANSLRRDENPEGARRNSGFCKKVRGAFQVCLILFIYGASGGCKAFENEIDVSREDANGNTVVLHTLSNEQVSNLDEAINSIKSDAEVRRVAASYKINLHTQAITLDDPISIKGLRLPLGSRILISGQPKIGTTISGGFRAEKFLKLASSIDGEFRYTLMLSDLPTEKRKTLIQKFASSSPNQVTIRAHGSMIIRPTRWPINEYAQVLDVSINQKGDLASFSFGAAVPEITDSVPGLWIGGYFTAPYLFVNARAEAADSSGRLWINRTHVRTDGGPPERVYLYNLQ